MRRKLQQIENSLERIGRDLRREELVMAAELKDRLSRSLTTEESIRHYNEWMKNAGLEHLMVK